MKPVRHKITIESVYEEEYTETPRALIEKRPLTKDEANNTRYWDEKETLYKEVYGDGTPRTKLRENTVKAYEQIVTELDLAAVIRAVNGLKI